MERVVAELDKELAGQTRLVTQALDAAITFERLVFVSPLPPPLPSSPPLVLERRAVVGVKLEGGREREAGEVARHSLLVLEAEVA